VKPNASRLEHERLLFGSRRTRALAALSCFLGVTLRNFGVLPNCSPSSKMPKFSNNAKSIANRRARYEEESVLYHVLVGNEGTMYQNLWAFDSAKCRAWAHDFYDHAKARVTTTTRLKKKLNARFSKKLSAAGSAGDEAAEEGEAAADSPGREEGVPPPPVDLDAAFWEESVAPSKMGTTLVSVANEKLAELGFSPL